jgi:branched-chain amino acid:cation transporter, LIVCS family
MKNTLLIVSTGFALFSMFFGSGNLVFPLTVGIESGGHFAWAALGICLTGVLVPFLGVIAIMLYQGKTERFFGSMGGKPVVFWFSLIALSLMGPFGVLARCITVAHGSFRLLFPETPLIAFSLVLCAIIFLLTINKSKIVPFLGSFLTPFLLLSLGAITAVGFWYSSLPEVTTSSVWPALTNGFHQGYQTMDLLAAFFFSTFIIKHLENSVPEKTDNSSMFRIFMSSILIGAVMLASVYLILVFLGATYAPFLVGVPPEEMLGVIAQKSLGSFSAPIVCMAVVLACLTTAVVLASLFADFLKQEVAKNLIQDKTAMVITLVIAFLISTLEFAGIARFLAPILEALYPALIVLTLLNIATQVWGIKSRKWPVVLTLAAKLCVF